MPTPSVATKKPKRQESASFKHGRLVHDTNKDVDSESSDSEGKSPPTSRRATSPALEASANGKRRKTNYKGAKCKCWK